MKAIQIKLALAGLITALVAVQYVLADCLKDGTVDCLSQCPTQPVCWANATLLSGTVTAARGGFPQGTQGNTSLKSTSDQRDCQCAYQFYDQNNSLRTDICPQTIQVYLTDTTSPTCQF